MPTILLALPVALLLLLLIGFKVGRFKRLALLAALLLTLGGAVGLCIARSVVLH